MFNDFIHSEGFVFDSDSDFAPVTLEVIASCGTKRMETSNTSHKQERTNKYYQKKKMFVFLVTREIEISRDISSKFTGRRKRSKNLLLYPKVCIKRLMFHSLSVTIYLWHFLVFVLLRISAH